MSVAHSDVILREADRLLESGLLELLSIPRLKPSAVIKLHKELGIMIQRWTDARIQSNEILGCSHVLHHSNRGTYVPEGR